MCLQGRQGGYRSGFKMAHKRENFTVLDVRSKTRRDWMSHPRRMDKIGRPIQDRGPWMFIEPKLSKAELFKSRETTEWKTKSRQIRSDFNEFRIAEKKKSVARRPPPLAPPPPRRVAGAERLSRSAFRLNALLNIGLHFTCMIRKKKLWTAKR